MGINILDYIQNNFRNDNLDEIMVYITRLGDAGIIWIVIALIIGMLNRKNLKITIMILLGLSMGLIVGNLVIKNLFMIDRPFIGNPHITLLIDAPLDYSFPSGHALSSFISAFIIFYNNKKWGILAIILALLISFSRMYLYVHYPIDIIASIILAIPISLFTIYIVNKIYNKEKLWH